MADRLLPGPTPLPPGTLEDEEIKTKIFRIGGNDVPITGPASQVDLLTPELVRESFSDEAKAALDTPGLIAAGRAGQMAEGEGRRISLGLDVKAAQARGAVDPAISSVIKPGEFSDLSAAPARFRENMVTNEKDIEKLIAIKDSMGFDEEDIIFTADPADPDEFTMLVRVPGTDQMQEWDNPLVKSLMDVVDVAPEMLSGLAAWMAGGGPVARAGGGPILRSLGAGAAQDVLTRGESFARGITGGELSSPEEVGSMANRRALFEVGGTFAGEILSGAGRTVTGRHAFLPSSVRELQETLDTLDAKAFGGELGGARAAGSTITDESAAAIGKIGVSSTDTIPILQRFIAMAGRVGVRARTQQLEKLNGLRELAVQYRARVLGKSKVNPGAVNQWIDRVEKNLKESIDSPIRGGSIHSADEVADGLAIYRREKFNEMQGLINEAGDAAERAGVTFNVSPHVPRVQRLIDGPQTNISKGQFTDDQLAIMKEVGDLPADARRAIDDPRNKINEGFGQEPADSFEQVRMAGTEINPELDAMMNQYVQQPLSGVRPARSEAGDVTSAFEQLYLWQLNTMRFLDGSNSTTELAAAEFMDVLNRTVSEAATSTGVGSRGGGKLIGNYRRAANETLQESKKFMGLMDGLNTRELVRAHRTAPEKLGETIIDPLLPDRVPVLRRVYRANNNMEGFDRVVDGYQQKLIRDPSRIGQKLDEWDPGTRRQFLTEGREEQLRKFGRDWERFREVKDILQDADQFGSDAVDAILNGDTATASKILEGLGGQDSPGGRMLRAGIMEHVITRTSSQEAGIMVMNPRAAERMLRGMRDKGNLDIFFSEADQEIFGLIETIGSFVPSGVGAGESIAAQELAQAALNFFRPVRATGAHVNIARIKFMSWLLTSKFSQGTFKKFIRMKPLRPGSLRDMASVRALTSMMSQVMADVDTTEADLKRRGGTGTSLRSKLGKTADELIGAGGNILDVFGVTDSEEGEEEEEN